MFLKHLESQIRHLGSSIHDLFDYVCGTSAGEYIMSIFCKAKRDIGGLIAIGIFLMH